MPTAFCIPKIHGARSNATHASVGPWAERLLPRSRAGGRGGVQELRSGQVQLPMDQEAEAPVTVSSLLEFQEAGASRAFEKLSGGEAGG